MNLCDIQIRDPFVLPVPSLREYFLFGTTDKNPWSGPGMGFDTYRSLDLIEWEGPIAAFRPSEFFWGRTQFWAPEVHPYRDRYYMFATFRADGLSRGTATLSSDRPQGPFELWSDGPITPRGAVALDGTLHVDPCGVPWLIYCHEWMQLNDGAISVIQLSQDLRQNVGGAVRLFHGSDGPWVRALEPANPQETAGPATNFTGVKQYVTDGPFVHRTRSGVLLMLWSSFGEQGYAMGLARSNSGSILGPWTHDRQPLWATDGGHGMFFRDFSGQLFVTLHQPNKTPFERAAFFPLDESDDSLQLK
jgi:hypothetical protein